jgi:hypothetical protein
VQLDESIKKPTVEATAIARIPVKVLEEAVDCGVCLGEIEAGGESKHLQCGHDFHEECISKWLSECKNTCPMCNSKIE